VQTIFYDPLPIPEDAVHFEANAHTASEQNGHYLLVPFDVKAQWGQARPSIWARFNGRVTYRGTLVKYGHPQHMLLIRKEIWDFLGLQTEASVQVTVWLDRDERTLELPSFLQSVLADFPDGPTLFAAQSFTARKEWALKFQPSARPETLEKRRNALVENLNQWALKRAKK
jgi:hypothetical protein